MAGYIIYGTYRGRREQIDTAKDKASAVYLAVEYQLAFGAEWQVTVRKAGAGTGAGTGAGATKTKTKTNTKEER